MGRGPGGGDVETEGWTDRSTEEDTEDGQSTGGRRGRKGPPTASVHSCDLWSVRQGAPQCVVPGSSRPGESARGCAGFWPERGRRLRVCGSPAAFSSRSAAPLRRVLALVSCAHTGRLLSVSPVGSTPSSPVRGRTLPEVSGAARGPFSECFCGMFLCFPPRCPVGSLCSCRQTGLQGSRPPSRADGKVISAAPGQAPPVFVFRGVSLFVPPFPLCGLEGQNYSDCFSRLCQSLCCGSVCLSVRYI